MPSITGFAARLLKKIASPLGITLLRRSTTEQIAREYPWLGPRLGIDGGESVRHRAGAVSTDAPDNSDPRLVDLRRRYRAHQATAHTVWTPKNLLTELSLERFREDNAYVWQTRVNNPIQYLLASYYAKQHDPLGLFPRLTEDGAFGAFIYEHDGKPVSRDMLDSIMEISFLEEQIGLSKIPDLTVLDIGAGYGRLAHRMAEALPNLKQYLCTDAVAESTFVSEFYTKYRKVEDRVTVVPLDEIERVLGRTRVDVALNIHSFSECSLRSIEYWLDLVARAKVPWLLVIPNTGDQLISWEADQSRQDFRSAIDTRGYALAVQQEKYARSADTQRFGLFPSTYFLFRRKEAV